MTPLERAARALCEARGADGFPILNADPDFDDYPLTDEGTDDLNPFTEADVLALARAVLLAIREPSEAMTVDALDYEALDSHATSRNIWRAMIDTALEEK